MATNARDVSVVMFDAIRAAGELGLSTAKCDACGLLANNSATLIFFYVKNADVCKSCFRAKRRRNQLRLRIILPAKRSLLDGQEAAPLPLAIAVPARCKLLTLPGNIG